MRDFIRLASGYSINAAHVSFIDFTRPTVTLHVGVAAIEATGDDAEMLRGMFEHHGGEEARPAHTATHKKK
jgi:hypothetical protein